MDIERWTRAVSRPDRRVVGQVATAANRTEAKPIIVPIPIGESGRWTAPPGVDVGRLRLVPPLVAELKIIKTDADWICIGLGRDIADHGSSLGARRSILVNRAEIVRILMTGRGNTPFGCPGSAPLRQN